MKEIPFARKYKVTTSGKVISKKGEMSPQMVKGGYLRVKLYTDEGKYQAFLVHRLVALTYLDNPDNLPEVNHKDGVKTNNNLDNLHWCTRTYNQEHAYATGLRTVVGEANPKAVLNSELVLSIYYECLNGGRPHDVAKKFGVAKHLVQDIKVKNSWKELLAVLPDIPKKPQKKYLSTSTVQWLCERLQEGVGPTTIVKEARNKNITLDNIYDIRSRRSFKHISCDYKW